MGHYSGLEARPGLKRKLDDLLDSASPAVRSLFETSDQNVLDLKKSSAFIDVFKEIAQNRRAEEIFNRGILHDTSGMDEQSKEAVKSALEDFMSKERAAKRAFDLFEDVLPSQIWHCCKSLCFLSIAVDQSQSSQMEELLYIHKHAEIFHARLENVSLLIERRKKGVGTSQLGFVSKSRLERNACCNTAVGTNRQVHLRGFASFIKEVLPFLYGNVDSPRGTLRPKAKLCTEAVCRLLCISRNFLYLKRVISNPGEASEEDIENIIDSAGLRMRQHRRLGERVSWPAIDHLQTFDCGCDTPCLSGMSLVALSMESDKFCQLSREMKPRHKENQFLLNRLYDPLTNSTSKVCNRALAAWYNVSESLIADVRRSLDAMISNGESSEQGDHSLLNDGTKRYHYHGKHPMNRVSDAVRERVENHLDVILRADPAGSAGTSVCRVYSPEINTQEKLRATLRESLSLEEGQDSELSSSTIQRMVNAYLQQRNYDRISFVQSDHNACPSCKNLQYSILQFSHERKLAEKELAVLSRSEESQNGTEQPHLDYLRNKVKEKTSQEDECIADLNRHNGRDMRIRKVVKQFTDHFRNVENSYRSAPKVLRDSAPYGWRSFIDRASITHQDDMTKVDLPHFIVTASADITRWRFDVNAHVNSVTNDALVFSHEQGMGAKNASLVVEEVLVEHLMRCKGESIKIVISDNASVGKNWVTTIALPQYMVDQGLADVVVILFLENNHGKFLADMLFGQFQTRRRRQTILGIDDMLSGFESIKKKTGKVEGFALNPLSSIDFGKVFWSLGYETTPPKDFGFVKRNIHYAVACSPGAKTKLFDDPKTKDLAKKLGPYLPDEPGMVRISTEPHDELTQQQMSYEDRFFDVPAVRLSLVPSLARADGDVSGIADANRSRVLGRLRCSLPDKASVPLVVPNDKRFASSGNGVVSARTVEKVGYNGIKFRKLKACPELRQDSTPLVRRAWPSSLVARYSEEEVFDDDYTSQESRKCAPVNWIVRRPVAHFCADEADWKGRYPPQNMLNATIKQGPRESEPWLPTPTYDESPFPIIEKTSACAAMKRLAQENSDSCKAIHVLDALCAVFLEMGDREGVTDPWFQRRVTVPSLAAIDRYRKELKLYLEREEGYPHGVRTLKQVFKEDRKISEEVQKQLRERGLSESATSESKKAKDEIVNKLYEEAELRPGSLERFKYLVEKDHERFALALKEFRKKQKKFDEDRGLHAVPKQS